MVSIVELKTVFHVGSLEPGDKGKGSYEGNGLSVSLYPEEWIEIAQLGGQPIWELRSPDGRLDRGGRFLDIHGLTTSQREAIEAWAFAQGLVSRQPRFKVSFTDPDTESSTWFLCDSREAAEAEFDEQDDFAVMPVEVVCATAAMTERCGFAPEDANAFGIACTFWAEDHGFDGCWWLDRLDPQSLSAPRGVINLRQLSEWSSHLVEDAARRPRPG